MDEVKKTQDDESLVLKIKAIVDSINSTSEPEELERLKSLIKKNVPFTRRGYFAAMLLKMLTEEKSKKDYKKDSNKKREEKKSFKKEEGERSEKERVMPEGAKTLYLNVGKMKNLYAKSLSLMLQKELGIKREDIYGLRVHDKYSFITMSEENCEKAIAAFNGKEINGRCAQINYSTK